MKIPTLKTERLILRAYGVDDILAIQEYFDNWAIVKYTGAPWPYPKDGAKTNMIEHTLPNIAAGKAIGWAITSPDVKRHDGFIGRIDYRFHEHEIDRGFWLAIPFQGKGYMTEAVIATQDYMFFEHGLDKFTVRNTQSNSKSYRIKEKTGATFMGKEQQSCSPHIDEPADLWEVTRENWAKIRGRSL